MKLAPGNDKNDMSNNDIIQLLLDNQIPLTLQRLAIAQTMFAEPTHLSADQILDKSQKLIPEISRATVYNSLKIFKEKGLIRELTIEPGKTIFDSNTNHHYHLYNKDTGEMTDIPADDIKVSGVPKLSKNLELEEIEVIFHIREKA